MWLCERLHPLGVENPIHSETDHEDQAIRASVRNIEAKSVCGWGEATEEDTQNRNSNNYMGFQSTLRLLLVLLQSVFQISLLKATRF